MPASCVLGATQCLEGQSLDGPTGSKADVLVPGDKKGKQTSKQGTGQYPALTFNFYGQEKKKKSLVNKA